MGEQLKNFSDNYQVIVSINGGNGVGKTTQVKLLSEKYKFIYGAPVISNYYDRDTSYNWWFEDSTQNEFCNTIYKAYSKRAKELKHINSPIIILDKGIVNTDARVVSTLMVKGMTYEEAKNMVNQYKIKYNVNENGENLALIIKNTDTPEDSIKLTQVRKAEEFLNISDQKRKKLAKYEQLQVNYLMEQTKNSNHIIINAQNKSIEEINEIIRYQIGKYAYSKISKINDLKQKSLYEKMTKVLFEEDIMNIHNDAKQILNTFKTLKEYYIKQPKALDKIKEIEDNYFPII